MDYLITFLEGIIAFVSPCMLPLLPIYVSYFAGGTENKKRAFINALGFVLGFTVVFVLLGAFAGFFGGFLVRYSKWVNIVAGGIIVLLGLNYMGVISISILNKNRSINKNPSEPGFLSSVLFGTVFSIGWSPCVGAFLGSALMLAASSQESYKGILMLLSFSIGLGLPFMVSALILDKLKGVFDFIKRNYKTVNLISGILLVLLGIAIITGYLGRILALLSF
ncbi:MAG: cytochrome c biogenesis protein CcdA [Clostridiaceae bacterium]|nr:cytochrome c biogenesis protein CcdA [Clostridiaceae bacterium]